MPTPEELAAQKAAEEKALAEAGKKKDELVTIKVDGKEQKLTNEEVIKLAEKSAGADARFMAASELKKEATKGLRIEQLYGEISSAEDVSAVEAQAKELAGLLKLDPDEFISSLKTETGEGKGKSSAEASGKKVSVNDLDEQGKAVMEYAYQMMLDNQITLLKNSINKAIDTESHCVKMVEELAGGDKALVSELKSELLDQTFKDVQRRVLSQEQTEPNSMISSSLQEVRGNLEKQIKRFGTPSLASKGIPVIPLGQPGHIPSEAYAKEPVKRKESTEPGYEENFVNRFFQRLIRAGRTSQ